jgi:hypothetical protein
LTTVEAKAKFGRKHQKARQRQARQRGTDSNKPSEIPRINSNSTSTGDSDQPHNSQQERRGTSSDVRNNKQRSEQQRQERRGTTSDVRNDKQGGTTSGATQQSDSLKPS